MRVTKIHRERHLLLDFLHNDQGLDSGTESVSKYVKKRPSQNDLAVLVLTRYIVMFTTEPVCESRNFIMLVEPLRSRYDIQAPFCVNKYVNFSDFIRCRSLRKSQTSDELSLFLEREHSYEEEGVEAIELTVDGKALADN